MSFSNLGVSKKLVLAFAVTVSVVVIMCVGLNLAMRRQALMERHNSESDEVVVLLAKARAAST